jgi:hypothetical protein
METKLNNFFERWITNYMETKNACTFEKHLKDKSCKCHDLNELM